MQGKVKTKVQVPGKKGRGNKQKHTHQKKSTVKKSTGRVIAPKKAKHIQMAKLKKNIEKAIGANIEKEIVSRASAQEPRSLTVVSNPSTSMKGKKNKK